MLGIENIAISGAYSAGKAAFWLHIRKIIAAYAFLHTLWIEPLTVHSEAGITVRILAPNSETASHVKHNYNSLILDAIYNVTEENVVVKYGVKQS